MTKSHRNLCLIGLAIVLVITLLVILLMIRGTRIHGKSQSARWPDGDLVRLVSIQKGTRPEYSTHPKIMRQARDRIPILGKLYTPLTMGGTVPEGTSIYLKTQSSSWSGLADQLEIVNSNGTVIPMTGYASMLLSQNPSKAVHRVFWMGKRGEGEKFTLRLRRGTNSLEFSLETPKN